MFVGCGDTPPGTKVQGLLGTGKGKIVEGGRDMAGGLSPLDQAVNRLQRCFFNPNLAALHADLRGNVLKEVEMSPAPIFMGNRGGAELATAHGT